MPAMKKKVSKHPIELGRSGSICVVPLGRVGDDLVRVISDSIQGILRLPVDTSDPVPLPQEAFMEARGQYNSMAIIKYLAEHHSRRYLKVLGVTRRDLCTPILTYVFGEAYLNGRSAVMSCFRLYRGYGAEPVSQEHFLDRAVKVALHEIGHTFNLPHCHTDRCVMRASHGLRDLDEKLNYLCNYCELFLSEAVADATRAFKREDCS
jgi:archaemetzincin